MDKFKFIKKEIWRVVEDHPWITTGIIPSQSIVVQVGVMRIINPILVMIRDDAAYKLLWDINYYKGDFYNL